MPMSVSSRWPRIGSAIALVLVLAAPGCQTGTQATSGEVRIRGSDTMLLLNRRLAEGFMGRHPGVAVRVSGGGTGSGVEALIDGAVQLCAASRPFAPAEVEALHARLGTLGVRFLVAQDALSVYLNPSNPVRDLSLDALRRLFSGEVRSWPIGRRCQ